MLRDIALVNIPVVPRGTTLRGTHRLLRDLVAAALMTEERPSASERLQLELGRDLTGVLQASLTGAPGHGHASQSLRPRAA